MCAEARRPIGDRCGPAQLEPLLTTGAWLYAGAGVYAGAEGAEYEDPEPDEAEPVDGATGVAAPAVPLEELPVEAE